MLVALVVVIGIGGGCGGGRMGLELAGKVVPCS